MIRYRIGAALCLALLAGTAGSATGTGGPIQRRRSVHRHTNGGNVFPGATRPFGMAVFSPELTPLPGKRFPIAAPGGYEWRANGVRGFSLTHVSRQ